MSFKAKSVKKPRRTWGYDWARVPYGYAYQGVTYDKGAKIYFVSKSKRDLNNFMKDLQNAYTIEDAGEQELVIQSIYEDYEGKIHTVYPYDRIGEISAVYDEGTVFAGDKSLGEGRWGHEYIRVPTENIKIMRGYVW
jgi:hypothetical protein